LWERAVEAVFTGEGTDAGVDGLVGLGFFPSSEKGEVFSNAELTHDCSKVIITVGEGCGVQSKRRLGWPSQILALGA
jgi:hypothetical protein